jgi:hypothetical protein
MLAYRGAMADTDKTAATRLDDLASLNPLTRHEVASALRHCSHWLGRGELSMPHEPLMIHCRAASICPAGKCLISAETKCDVRCSATSPMWESVTTPIRFMRL